MVKQLAVLAKTPKGTRHWPLKHKDGRSLRPAPWDDSPRCHRSHFVDDRSVGRHSAVLAPGVVTGEQHRSKVEGSELRWCPLPSPPSHVPRRHDGAADVDIPRWGILLCRGRQLRTLHGTFIKSPQESLGGQVTVITWTCLAGLLPQSTTARRARPLWQRAQHNDWDSLQWPQRPETAAL